MKNLHVFLFVFGIIYSGIIMVMMLGVENLSWAKDHSLYIAFLVGLMITLNATKSLMKMRQRIGR